MQVEEVAASLQQKQTIRRMMDGESFWILDGERVHK